MFLKLLKHDMKSIFKLWWIVLPVLPVLLLVDTVALRVMTQAIANMARQPSITDGDSTVMILVVMVAYFVFLGVTVLISLTSYYTLILSVIRFYKNLFTDEGYLTFTLPVKRSSVLLSKTLTAVIYMTLHSLILTVGVIIMAIFAFPTMENEFLFGFTAFKTIFSDLWVAMAGMRIWTVFFIIESVIYSFFATFASIGLIFLCLTLGAIIVKKLKLAAGIGLYMLIRWIAPTIATIALYVFYFIFGAIFVAIASFASTFTICLIAAIIMALLCVLVIAAAHVFYFITRNCLERRLNLA